MLDPLLLDTPLVSKAADLMGISWQPRWSKDPSLVSLTFRDVQNQPIKFYSSHRPYKRCLKYHATQALRYARHCGWHFDELGLVSLLGSPGFPKAVKVTTWLLEQSKSLLLKTCATPGFTQGSVS